MKIKALYLFIMLTVSINSYSQISFQEGYLINENNQKINCLIENKAWKNTPNNFKYKLSADGEAKIGDLTNVKEFAINGENKYIRAEVNVDRSGINIENLNEDKNPVFVLEKLFLQVILDGKASLYANIDGITRYFYKIDNSEIKQLVYKSYLVKSEYVAKNNLYREQIYRDLKCETISMSECQKLTYRKKYLKKIFSKYNACNNSNVVDFETKEKRDLFNLSIRSRYNNSSFSMDNSASDLMDFDFGSSPGFALGIEAEFVLPFNKNTWSIIVEPTYQYYKTKKSQTNSNVVGGVVIGEVDYKSIELPIGFRRYFFINKKTTIFANASLLIDFSSNSTINFARNDDSKLYSYDLKSQGAAALGIGCKFQNRYSFEMRYLSGRSLLHDYQFFSSSYKTFSLILGYSLF